jgi:hypothetical protein
MNDKELIRIFFLCILCIIAGALVGNYAASFSIPTMKIWESPRSYDHILIVDDVVCIPANEFDATYYRYDTVAYNKSEYIVQKTRVGNTTVKSIIVCEGGKG